MIDCVIKLGGAAITVKDQLETLQPDTIARVAGLISTLQSCGKRLVVVHGAGSFGHQHAAEAGLGGKCKREALVNPRPKKTENVSAGVAATRLALMKLHQIVLSELVSMNVPAVGISPFARETSHSKTTEDASIFSAIKKLVQLGLVPVLHGDIVLDEDTSTGFSILGGDVIMTQLCRQLKPKVAVFMTNVKGIYDRPPNGNSGANLLRRIVVGTQKEGSWQAFDGSGAPTAACMVQTDASDHDTTGGMRAKVQEALEIAMMGVATRVVEAGTRSALEACLNQELAPEWVGTEIVG